MAAPTFSWIDYFLFVFMLVLSALVGVYFGFIKKQNTADDYLLGGKQMGILPVTFSIISSGVSGFTFLSVPADIYKYGISYALNVPAIIILGLASYYVFIPVFYKLQVTSTYEYFNRRFNYRVRVFASLLYAINTILFLPIVIYIPALALEQVTTMNIHLVTPIVSGVCIFYTTLGGLKAVVWTDAIQFIVMMASLIVVVVIGVLRSGGLLTILENANIGKRLDISFDIDFLKRDTFWACFFGQSVHMLSTFAVNQSPVQKLLSLPSFDATQITIIFSMIGFAIINSLCVFTGLIIFTNYINCDPYEINVIKSYDQILPLFVMEEISFVPGLSGLFISGIFSAGLSTLSAILNCLAATIYEDFISPFISQDTSQQKISFYLKLIVVFLGILSTSLVYVVEKLGSLVALTLSLAGVTSGPLLGLFCAGMLFPMVNSKGALFGGITSLMVMMWIVMTSQWYKMNGIIAYPTLPVSTHGCNGNRVNITKNAYHYPIAPARSHIQTCRVDSTCPVTMNSTPVIYGYLDIMCRKLTDVVNGIMGTEAQQPNPLYRVSFYWYASMGFIVCVFVALAVSWFTKEKQSVNKDCISPVVHFLLKEKKEEQLSECDTMCLEKLNAFHT